jgi:hypothetical protein
LAYKDKKCQGNVSIANITWLSQLACKHLLVNICPKLKQPAPSLHMTNLLELSFKIVFPLASIITILADKDNDIVNSVRINFVVIQ